MEKILKEHEIDIVISAVGGVNILDQLALIEAIKTVGTIKVYIYHCIYIRTVVFPAPYVHFLLIFTKQGGKRPC